MPLDPHIAEMLSMMQEEGIPPMHEVGPQAARAQLVQLTCGNRTPEQIVAVADTRELQLPGAEGDLQARAYLPEGEGPFPVIAFFHGGGWVVGDLDTHDNVARNLCHGCRAAVISVAYRLAPEHPFPAAVEDAIAASRWIAGHPAELGGNKLFAVAGESAGGNLAAVVAQTLHAEGVPVVGQFLMYPVVDFDGGYPSESEYRTGYFLEEETSAWFARQYLSGWKDTNDPRLSPLHAADLSGLPPTVLVTAEYDALRDQGEAYGEALRAAGVPTQMERCAGMIHAFFDMGAISPAAQAAIDKHCERFGRLLSG